jgi:hypothetical protein
MATTTNYSWTTPDDTDLVKDGAAAIRTLGSSVDTTTKALNPSTTLGDIEYRSSTANTNTRLAIGSTGDVLTVAAGVPSWAAPAGGGGANFVELNSGGTSLSGSTTTISGISGKDKIMVLIVGASLTGTGYIAFRVNGVTSAYNLATSVLNFTSMTSSNFGSDGSTGSSRVDLLSNDTAADTANAYVMFEGCNSTGVKAFHAQGSNQSSGIHRNVGGFWNNTATITEVNIITSSTFDAGTVYVYTSA